VSRRALILSSVFAVVAAACSDLPQTQVDLGSGTQFLPQVADFQDNVGLFASMAVSADGTPFVSYFGFPEELAEGEIALPRPVGSPNLPAVNVASLSTDGIWTRGAVAMASDPPTGVPVPFGPQTVPTLKTMSPESVNGTDVVVDGDGALHVAWTSNDGIWYASGTTSSTAEKVFDFQHALREAGPMGGPSVALDESGAPWVAYTVQEASRQVFAATSGPDGWTTTVVADLGECRDCPLPGRTEVGVTSDGPEVVYADPTQNAVVAARQDGDSWTSAPIESGVDGAGIAMAVGADGTAYVTYGAGGDIHLAVSSGSDWNVSKVGEASDQADQQTGVAVDESGAVYATWLSAGGVQLAKQGDDGFEPITTRQTDRGQYPSVGVTADGSTVFLAWYDPVDQDLEFGSFGETGDVLVAAPSPAPSFGGGGASEACEPDGSKLTVVASDNAAVDGFDPPTCLAVAAGKQFTLTFENNDTVAGGIHNVSVYPDAASAGPDSLLFSTGEPVQGPETQTTDPPVTLDDPGSFFFRCDVHTTSMVGTFIVAEAP
jgi:plastocyanin